MSQDSKKRKKPIEGIGRYVGIDLGDKRSRVCMLNEDGQVVVEEWVMTTPEAFLARFGDQAKMRIAMEVGTHSRWASRVLKPCGHDVRVADARTLAQWVRADASLLSPIQHRAEAVQMDLTLLHMRDNLVETRTRMITSIRGVVKATGGRLPECVSATFPQEVGAAIPEGLRPAVAPVLEVIDKLNEEIFRYDCTVEHWGRTRYPECVRLSQVNGVGTLTAVGFLLTVGDKERFSRSRDIGPYLGLRPRLDQSGESQPELRITKAGDSYLRKKRSAALGVANHRGRARE